MITIPKPCHEDWNKMTPKEQGRHCDLCSKVVIDFSSKSETEIADFFRANAGKKVCGNFRTEQVTKSKNNPDTVPANRLSFSPTVIPVRANRSQVFLAALVLVFGGLLFSSCNTSDFDSPGKKYAMVLDTPAQNELIKGKVKYVPPADTAKKATTTDPSGYPQKTGALHANCTSPAIDTVIAEPEIRMTRGEAIYIPQQNENDQSGVPK